MSSPNPHSAIPGLASACLKTSGESFLWSTRWLIAALLCFLLATTAIYARATLKSQADPRHPLKVDTIPVQHQNQYTVTRWFSGRIEPRQRVSIASELAGKIIAVKVNEGDTIRKGDIVVVLDTDILETEKAQLKARLSGIDAELKLADLRLNRQNNLQKKGFSSDDTIDAIETQITNLQSSHKTLASQVDSVNIRLQKANIRAPFDAHVQARRVDEGAVIDEGTPLIELLEIATAEVKVGVPVGIANTLSLGQELTVETVSTQMLAEIISVAPGVDLSTQTVAIRLRLVSVSAEPDLSQAPTSQSSASAPSDPKPRFGEFVSLKLLTPVKSTGFWVSDTALIEGERGLWSLYSVDTDNIVRKHSATVVFNNNEKAFINSSISDNTKVIVSGLHRVTPGMRVEI